MLSKLIGYELKATRRIFLPAYVVVLILSILNGIFMILPDNLDTITMPFGILLTVYVLAMFAICVLTFAYMISRFYKNLLGDEGYLMFTLPARPSELVWAKCITSTLWMLFTAIVCCVSLFILATPIMIYGTDFSIFWRDLGFGLQSLWQEYSVHMIFLPIVCVILGIVWTANFCMHIYACLSIGSLANKHRLGYAFLAYLGFGILAEILLMIGVRFSDFLPNNLNLDILVENNMAQIYVACLIFLIYYIIKLIINFVITNYILSRHLNLQ
ncbi:MAG: hypothetical protein Q4C40_07080 [Eubacteriales bacterium]|nr:hypothetical protein [Eubacteriales bacterium]